MGYMRRSEACTGVFSDQKTFCKFMTRGQFAKPVSPIYQVVGAGPGVDHPITTVSNKIRFDCSSGAGTTPCKWRRFIGARQWNLCNLSVLTTDIGPGSIVACD